MTLSLDLDPHTERRLAAIVSRTGKSAREHLREALLDHLEEIEDQALAVEPLETPTRRWTLDELERGLDLER